MAKISVFPPVRHYSLTLTGVVSSPACLFLGIRNSDEPEPPVRGIAEQSYLGAKNMGKSVKFLREEKGNRAQEGASWAWKRRLVDLIRLESGLWGDRSPYLDGGNRRFGGADGLGAEGKERVESGRDTGSRAGGGLWWGKEKLATRNQQVLVL
jgi:hypothetical protein